MSRIVPDTLTLGPNLTPEEAEAIFARGKEAVIFALLELAAQVKSPRGTTLTGCAVLEEHDALEKLMAKCLAAAMNRAEELARGEV